MLTAPLLFSLIFVPFFGHVLHAFALSAFLSRSMEGVFYGLHGAPGTHRSFRDEGNQLSDRYIYFL